MRRILFNMLKLQMLMLMTFSAFGQGSLVFILPTPDSDAVDNCWYYTSDPDINLTIPIYFVNLEFETVYDPIAGESDKEAILPCDLHIGLTLGDFSPIFSSAIENIVYLSELDYNGDEYFVGSIPFNISEEVILEYFDKYPCERGLINVPVEVGLFCQEDGLYAPVNYCEDYDLWAPVIWNSTAPDPNNCLISYQGCLKTQCVTPLASSDTSIKGIGDVDTQEISISSFDNHLIISSNLEIKDNITYMIHDLSGKVLRNKNLGLVGNENILVEYDDLPTGMYIFTTKINGVIKSKKIVKL